jgi:ketosteroid isomerase-like protein
MDQTAQARESMDAAERLFSAIERGDVDAIRAVYAPDVKIWHNFDGVEQSAEENLAVLAWVINNIAEVAYTEVRRSPTATGFVQQHVMRGRMKKSGREIALPACIVCTVKGGRITRLDEYLDSAQTAALRG